MVDGTPPVGPPPLLNIGAGMQSRIHVPALAGTHLHEQVSLYLDTLEAAGRTPKTVHGYRWVLERFFALSRTPDSLAVRDLLDSFSSVNTKAYALVCVRQFFKFLHLRGLSSDDPSRGIPMPRSRRRAYGLISEDQFQALYNALQDPRMRVLVSTLYRVGSRVTETLLLRVEHVSFTDDGYGWVDFESRKGGEAGFAVFDHRLSEILKPWLVGRRGWVFPGKFSGRMKNSGVARFLKIAGERASIPGVVTPHRLRHSFINRAAEEGWPQMLLQKQLGHRDPTSTAWYFQPSQARLLGFLRRQNGRSVLTSGA